MNKGELVSAIADRTNSKKTEVEAFLSAFIDVVTETLSSNGDIRLVGFGTFASVERKETKGRNPSTGAEIVIPASRLPKFKPGQTLKDAVNTKKR